MNQENKTQEIVKELRVVILRNGIELPIEKDRVDNLLAEMERRRFVEIDGRLVNTADITGIFSPADLEASTRRKNGQWQGKDGKWFDKGTRLCPICENVLPQGLTCGNCGGR